MSDFVRVLIVEDLRTDAELAEREIRKVLPACEFQRVEIRKDFLDVIESFCPDIILSDYKLPEFNGMEALELAREQAPDIPFIMLTGSMNEDTAVECMKAGAWDYVIKEHIKRLGGAVTAALEQKKLRIENRGADEALRESEKKYRVVVENASDAISITWNSKINFINEKQLFKVTGYKKEELEERPFSSIIHPEDIEDVIDRRNRRMKGEEVPSVNQFRIIAKDGSTRWIESNTILFEWEKREAELAFLKEITEQKNSEIEIKNTLEKLRKSLEGTVMALALATEIRDPYTAGHQRRSTDLARSIAQEMGLTRNIVDGIRMAGLIHDLGKIGIPADILSKPGKLTRIEYDLIKTHPQTGYDILKDVEFDWPIADIVVQHHERMDGSGYPRNLKGEEILMEARIMAVADVVEAMASHRPYRPGLGIDAALNEIEKNRGIFYDNAVADACLRLFREKGFQIEGA